ncbi:unnamed protein product (macronuclear) [Paramecium tetraurelia]|uniref:Uncharacterized protein n=1 Tax=Paramecium tetraurelia TaxID=5888 RepID=A0BW91_PARTE|nr:uncharacterized protein GSPATT00032660001 [Paramecium tetraurelia]CAK62808.1 unnamed protein product [Paramecium tetraurelia]|eukprot:XP_001430206.1 hypothetical protein (macronuclear) [Paramecium tetraurelia strain d4-2]
MDLEEQQGLIPNITPAKPHKQVRKVRYTKSGFFNYLIAILALIILGLMSYIVIDITGYEIMHLSFKSTTKQQNITDQIPIQNEDQSQIDTMDYTSQLDNLLWDDTNNDKENQEVQTEEFLDENFSTQDEITQTEEPQIENQNSEVQTFQSATLEIGDQSEIQDQVQILNDDQQLEQYSLLQSGSSIITPKIDDSKYNYVELPNKMKILLIQNDEDNAEIYLNDFKGYWQTNYFVKCDQCQITVKEQQTQYFIQTKSDQILNSFEELSKAFASETPQLKQTNYQKSSWEELLTQISNEKHPLSSKYQKASTFQLSPNQMVLIIKGKFNSDELMNGIIQSDIVLLRDKDIQESENIQIINQPGSIIKWNNQKDLNSVKIIYELEDSKELNFIDYFIQSSLQNYIINKRLGLDVKSSVILDQNNRQLYQIQIALPFQDQMDYDQRELAYRLSKIVINFANSLEAQLINNDNELTDYCKQMIDQLQQINNLQFDYDNQEQDYMEIAKNLKLDLIEEVLHYKYLVQIVPEALKKTLDNLQSTKNLMIVVSDSQYHTEYSFIQIQKGSATQDLLFLTQDELDINQNGISYSLKEITDQTKQFIEKTEEEINFVFPQVNKFIPQNLDLVEQTEPFEVNDHVEVVVDVSKKLPKINADITIFTYGQFVYAQYLYERIIMDYQDAINVGYGVDVNQNQYFQIQLQGWSDHYTNVFKGIMEIVKEKPDEELKGQLQYKFDMLPEHLKLINSKIESILIANYKKPQFGVIGQNYKIKLTGNIEKDQAEELDQMLHKALSFKQKLKQDPIKIYSLKNQEIDYQLKAKDKWHLLINYYQFSQLNQSQQKLLNRIQEFVQLKSQESHIIFEQRTIGCTQGFFLIVQSSKDLEGQKEKIDKLVDQSLNELDKEDGSSKQSKKSKYSSFWKKESGKITFFIDDQNRSSTMPNLESIQCK